MHRKYSQKEEMKKVRLGCENFVVTLLQFLCSALRQDERRCLHDAAGRLLHREHNLRDHRLRVVPLGQDENRVPAASAALHVEGRATKELTYQLEGNFSTFQVRRRGSWNSEFGRAAT